MYNQLPLDFEEIYEQYLRYADRLQDYVTDTSLLIWGAIRDDQNVLRPTGPGKRRSRDRGP